MDSAAFVVTSDERIFAAGFEGDSVVYAIEVYEPQVDLLADFVDLAVQDNDVTLASWLDTERAYGRAQAISAHWQVLA